MSKTIFITGVSGGMGRAFAVQALKAGHLVVGTVRRPEDKSTFEELAPGRSLARVLDVTDSAAVTSVIDGIEETVAPIDVLIANAGYGLEGTVEETSMADARHQFEVNVFGVFAVVKAVLPYMRRRRRGHIFTVSSMAGLTALPGVAFYGASKFAIEGFSDSLAQEVAGFGIHVTCLALGSFRTEWAGRSMVRAERTIADYDDVFGPIRTAREAKDGNQAGDPAAAAKAVLSVLNTERPPVHLVLGNDALRLLELGRKRFQDDVDAWTSLTTSTDFAAEPAR
ncbi:SDR family NAD(P)-dependent oxidoreductase [Mycobacterium sp. CBMA293]|uniref:oxidoreductase n=1 Tax=unclassified Mycolicibacterium TaxID=2636767 RepID=UPI0012DC9946|nr:MULTISPECIES: oxidoreductase [unclassified Mycolicibacterium]MUL46765.1 SDR family NAD(P)-dependent oxidoreductase [Mycolicibacterium sp. CBMA 360]MUL57450.1 SDR family NAD(P)-dependent oxidoreductase [Mycolicibacterium sp. CBMA 335]MUL70490.1 SDR family NAD(P)-dependent oxidoreductase [Mycolicibacterium sp. CBMA 311]MUL92538.1 SDR family NAD(P)-dependent oxidoreductase [Mycolicibacterium sp. CBMA 230]MUM04913.1 short-chain dehydrogenase/reductase [Mycolicibacterium sp. CBMA 213]